jgi:hypothetical protein
VKDCASKKAAIRAALRIARRINCDICEGDVIQCQRVSLVPVAARVTALAADERPPKPSGVRLVRSSSQTSLDTSTHTNWLETWSSDVRKSPEPQFPDAQARGATYRFFAVDSK